MEKFFELLGNLELSMQDVGEITGFIMGCIMASVFFGNIFTEFLISFFDFLGELTILLFRWIIKHIRAKRQK